MIRYLCVRPETVQRALDLMGADPGPDPEFQVATYANVWGKVFTPGTVIFSDLERLDVHQLEAAEGLWAALARAGAGRVALNRPAEAHRRHRLLTRLQAEGVNRFAAYRAADLPSALRYPVFIRGESDHGGSQTPLLHSRSELDAWTARLALKARLAGSQLSLLVVEYADAVGTDGLYRKYSAFRIGTRIVPRHVLFSRHWVVKKPELVDEELIREERCYLDENPHEAWIRRVFDLARIDYGRIDYGLAGGDLQVWEINTNPTVVPMAAAGGRASGCIETSSTNGGRRCVPSTAPGATTRATGPARRGATEPEKRSWRPTPRAQVRRCRAPVSPRSGASFVATRLSGGLLPEHSTQCPTVC